MDSKKIVTHDRTRTRAGSCSIVKARCLWCFEINESDELMSAAC